MQPAWGFGVIGIDEITMSIFLIIQLHKALFEKRKFTPFLLLVNFSISI
jgi:hypothetical protein